MAAAGDIYIAIPQKYSDTIFVKVTLTFIFCFFFFFSIVEKSEFKFVSFEVEYLVYNNYLYNLI